MAPGSKRQFVEVEPEPEPDQVRVVPVQISTCEPLAVDIKLLEGKFGMRMTPATTLLNKFVRKLQEGLRVKKNSYEYTPLWIREPNKLHGDCVHISHLPDYEPEKRHYQILEGDVTLIDEFNSGESPFWRLQARNTVTPWAPPVQLFVLAERFRPHTGQLPYLQRMITKKVCKDKEIVLELGKILVRNMNKFPADLNIKSWEQVKESDSPTGSRIVQERRVLELAALVEWQSTHHPSFDFKNMPTWVSHPTAYGNPYKFYRHKTNIRIVEPRAAYWGKKVQKPSRKVLDFLISVDRIDDARVRASESLKVPKGLDWLLGSMPTDRKLFTKPGSSDAQVVAAFDVARAIQYDLIGLIGSENGIEARVDRFRTEFYAGAKTMRRVEGGPYNGKTFWTDGYYSGMQYEFALTAAVIKDLDNEKGNPSFTMGVTWRVDAKSAQACIFQHTLRLLAQKTGLMDVLISSIAKAQSIALGYTTEAEIIELYADDHEDPRRAEYYCMMCHRLYLLTHLVINPKQQLVCLICAKGQGQPQGRKHHFHRICSVRAYAARRRDIQYGPAPTWSTSVMAEILFAQHKREDPDHWTPGYMDGIVEYNILDDRSYTIGQRRKELTPYIPSLDKVYPSWYSEEDGMCLHHPDNSVMVLLCIQFLKGILSPSALPLAKRALALKKKSDTKLLTVQYEASIANEWEIIERAADHQYMISKLTPYFNKDRIPMSNSNDQLHLKSMQYSGVWDGSTYADTGTKNSMQTRGSGMHQSGSITFSKKVRKEFDLWSDDKFDNILKLIDNIEDDTSPTGLNKHALTLPRIGIDQMPWLWLPTHEPTSDVFDKTAAKCFYFYEFCGRFWTLDELCDAKNETIETPETLLLEWVVQWFEHAGRCHLFGMRLTCVTRHFSSYSLGRGVTQLTEAGEVAILPGAPMATGWTVLSPTQMSQYNIARRTCVYESWRANAMRSCFLGGKAVLPKLEAAVEGLSDATEWYAAVGRLEDYPVITCSKRYPLKPRGRDVARLGIMMDSTTAEDITPKAADSDEELEFKETLETLVSELDIVVDNDVEQPLKFTEVDDASQIGIADTTLAADATYSSSTIIDVKDSSVDDPMDIERPKVIRPSLREQVSMSDQQLIELGPLTKADEEEFMDYCSSLYDKVLATYHTRLRLCGRELETVAKHLETVVSQQTHDDWVTDHVQWASLVRDQLPPAMVQEHDLRMDMLVAEMARLRKVSGQ